MLSKRHIAGISLIEIMIALVVLGILLALGAPSFSVFMKNSQIRDGAGAIQNGLQIARAEAIKRNEPVTFNMAGPNTTWTVESVSELLQSHDAATGNSTVEVSVPPPAVLPIAITFDGLGKTTLTERATIQLTNPSAGACDTGPNTGDMRCLNVVVSVGGQIKMCDPHPSVTAAAGDTRRCP
jgi:type IV fimbrial biogenesis protein FimT